MYVLWYYNSIHNSHIGTQQINSRGTANLLTCLVANAAFSFFYKDYTCSYILVLLHSISSIIK